MPNLTTVTIVNDNGDNVAYYPAGINAQTGVALLAAAGAIYDARPKLTVSATPPTGKSTKFKTKLRLSMPHMDTIDTTKRLDESILEVSVSVSKVATLANRRDLRVLASNLLLDTLASGTIDAQEGVW